MENNIKIKSIFNRAFIILLIIIIGMIYVYPDVRFILESGKHYKGIGFTGTPEELLYLSRLNGIYKGSVNLSDIYCFEHQSDPWFRPFMGEFILGNLGKIMKINLVTLDILMSAILNIILSILIFIFSYQLSKSTRLSIICSLTIMFGYNIFTKNIFVFKEIFFTGNYVKPLWFLRPISPQFYYIPFFAALIYINRATSLLASKSDIIISASVLGLLFYCNVYYWTFIYAGLGVLLLLFLVTKERRSALNIALIYAGSVIIAIPYFISFFKVINHPAYEYLQKIYMISNSHKIFFPASYVVPALLVSFLLFVLKHKHRFFIISFLAGGIICLNQQVFTGKIMLQQWLFYTNKTFSIISIFVAIELIVYVNAKFKFMRSLNFMQSNSFKTGLFSLIALTLIFTAFLQQNNYYRANKEYFLEKQKAADVFKWLRENTHKSDVVLTDPYNDFGSHLTNYRFLLTYTNNFSYIAEPACMLISEEETMYRILAAFIFLGYGDDDIRKYISISKRFYASADPAIWVNPLPESYYKMLITRYYAMKKQKPVDMVKKFKVDYILIRNEAAAKLIEKYMNNLNIVYKDADYFVLKLI